MESTTPGSSPGSSTAANAEAPQWRPLSAIDRRVLGVMVEKAKTTPSAYPMTLNAICVGANQKSNRDPEMNLEPERVQTSLDRLRELGAVGEIQGDGRVAKFRHYLYKWMGVDKTELAVMAELLLRGTQSVGELRARAARMEPIADINALRPIVASLVAKGLIVALAPEGRGQIVTHALYERSELERIRAEYLGRAVSIADDADEPGIASPAVAVRPPSGPTSPAPTATLRPASPAPSVDAILRAEVERQRREIDELREQVQALRRDLDDFRALLT